MKMLEPAIIRIIAENANLEDEINIGELGSRLQGRYPDFDVRNYGYSYGTIHPKMRDLLFEK